MDTGKFGYENAGQASKTKTRNYYEVFVTKNHHGSRKDDYVFNIPDGKLVTSKAAEWKKIKDGNSKIIFRGVEYR